MYKVLKRLVLLLMPSVLLDRFEPKMRRAYAAIFHSGNDVYCDICRTHADAFIIHDTGDLICTGCGSLARNRLLWQYLRNEIRIESGQKRVLHFSPAKSLKRKLENIKELDYVTCDFEGVLSKNRYDITALPESDDSFDLIICYHVLEHIINDLKAMEELYRVLKPGGVLLAQVPFGQSTYEDYTITSPLERLEHFGQEDHVRIYDLNEFCTRLRQAQFEVNPLPYAKGMDSEVRGKQALDPEETIVVAAK